jgi:hypothetical protein
MGREVIWNESLPRRRRRSARQQRACPFAPIGLRSTVSRLRRIDVEQAWSGSSIGYHASVCYLDLGTRPPGARFSSEWSRIPSFVGGTTGEWREYRDGDILERIYEAAGNPSLTPLSEAATELNTKVEDVKATFDSILSLAGLDAYLQSRARALRCDLATDSLWPGRRGRIRRWDGLLICARDRSRVDG